MARFLRYVRPVDEDQFVPAAAASFPGDDDAYVPRATQFGPAPRALIADDERVPSIPVDEDTYRAPVPPLLRPPLAFTADDELVPQPALPGDDDFYLPPVTVFAPIRWSFTADDETVTVVVVSTSQAGDEGLGPPTLALRWPVGPFISDEAWVTPIVPFFGDEDLYGSPAAWLQGERLRPFTPYRFIADDEIVAQPTPFFGDEDSYIPTYSAIWTSVPRRPAISEDDYAPQPAGSIVEDEIPFPAGR